MRGSQSLRMATVLAEAAGVGRGQLIAAPKVGRHRPWELAKKCGFGAHTESVPSSAQQLLRQALDMAFVFLFGAPCLIEMGTGT